MPLLFPYRKRGLRRDGSTSSPCTTLHPESIEGSVERKMGV
ncbi:MAG TPA: hypothetical protein ACFYD7_03035 [Candidatus Wujingus californicus]|nr:hypothetical protein [Candidatus Brocadiales bacterium]